MGFDFAIQVKFDVFRRDTAGEYVFFSSATSYVFGNFDRLLPDGWLEIDQTEQESTSSTTSSKSWVLYWVEWDRSR